MSFARGLGFIAESVAVVLLASLLAALLIRTAPGFQVDVREANSSLSEQSIQALRAERAKQTSLAAYTAGYFRGLLRGDLGFSQTANRPVTELLRDRLPMTALLVMKATVIAFILSFALAAAVRLARHRWPALVIATGNTLLLTLPAGVVALLAVFTRTGIVAALVAVVACRIYVYCDRLIAERLTSAYVLSAETLGLSRSRIMFAHVLPSLGPEAAGLASLAVVTALNAALPLEVLCGGAGVGQMAWSAAMERDLPVVAAVTLVMIVITRAGTAASRALLPGAVGQSV